MDNSANIAYQPAQAEKTQVNLPVSTYRIQLNKDFTLKQLQGIVAYLHELGVDTIYAAPVQESRAGSMHGYDVTDPHTIDPEIGHETQFENLLKRVQKLGMQWLQDIVPNHMAFDFQNKRLMDVLERGPVSPYYQFFDIDWNHHDAALKGKVSAPFLGDEPEKCISRNEIQLQWSDKGFTIRYFDTHFPLSIPALKFLSRHSEETFKVVDGYILKSASLKSLEEWSSFKEEWISDNNQSTVLDSLVQEVNANTAQLQQLLDQQYYRLDFWKQSYRQINYRRFFTVNELICLRMEDRTVFDEYHKVIASLVQRGLFSGVRVDHIDGLYDPTGYISRLRKTLGEKCYIIAEKILERSEALPTDWKLQGTSGYEFLAVMNKLFTDGQGARKLTNFYRTIVPGMTTYHKMVFENKKMILENYMQGEWDNLVHEFEKLALHSAFEVVRMKQAIGLLLISLDVYRIYPDTLPLSGENREVLERAFAVAKPYAQECTEELNYLQALFLKPQADAVGRSALSFLKRMMQFTGPLTAKGVEDTTFYIYNPLISHDEVGDTPQHLAISIDNFHSRMLKRLQRTPHSLNATATHDTKRGEDARIRLNILSELSDTWEQQVTEWRKINEKDRVCGDITISPNDEYLIYQALVGGFPENLDPDETFLQRFDQFIVKALREAKVLSDWSAPDEQYEQACVGFVRGILENNHPFRKNFVPFVEVVMRYSNLYALSHVLVKMTAPGIPDIYQGCELWDLSFVDPDNRRPVDFEQRGNYLSVIKQKDAEGPTALLAYLRQNRKAGLEKLFVTFKCLHFRKEFRDLVSFGEYIPLPVAGNDTVVMAYCRCLKNEWALIVVPLALAKTRMSDQPYSDNPDEKRFIALPENAPSRWKNLFTSEIITTSGKLFLFDALKDFPVALFTAQTN